jgi:hypothetical protein
VFGYPIEIRQDVVVMTKDQVVPCRVRFVDSHSTPTATKGVVYLTPRVPLSFSIGIEVKFNEEVAKVSTPNNTPPSKIEEMMSVRWGVRVQFAPNQSSAWLLNKCYEFVSVVSGQKAALMEKMRAQLESEQPPTEIEFIVIVCDGTQARFLASTRVKADASWDQMMEAWRSQAH